MRLNEFLKDKEIVILGFGKQGKATYNYLRKNFPTKKIAIRDKNFNISYDNFDDNVDLKLGDEYLNDIEKFDLIIKAPGVVLKDIDTSNLEDRIITDYELLLKYTNALTIGITGSKGKSTTSTLIYKMLEEQGRKVIFLGNIGNPIFDQIDQIDKDTIVVLEVSSHTLEFAKASPNIAILLNIYPEHLDHCNSLNDYINAKFNIAKFQTENDCFIYNAENELMNKVGFNYKINDIAVCLENLKINLANKVYLENKGIYFNDKYLMSTEEERKIKGIHMLNNIMFVLAISQILKLDLEKTINTIKNTEPLKHRMEFIGKIDEVEYYDDAIATIPEATINCIETLKNVDTLICGGMDRGVSQEKLIEFLKKSNVNNIICMPETGNYIYDALAQNKNVYKIDNLEEAVKIAKEKTKKGRSCVLSPSASSYNDFKNFEEKGDLFKKYVIG